MAQGWVKIYRDITGWQWYGDINVARVFIHLLLTVNHRDTQWQGKTIYAGQRVTSLSKLAEETGLTLKQLRTALDKLKKDKIVAVTTTNRYSVVSVVNWGDYQGDNYFYGTQKGTPGTNKGQSEGRQRATNNNDNNNNNEKNEKNIVSGEKRKNSPSEQKKAYGSYANVLLTDSQLGQLKERFGLGFEEKLERFSTGLEMKGYRYKNHYLAMLAWFEKEEVQKADSGLQEDFIMRNMTKVPVFIPAGE